MKLFKAKVGEQDIEFCVERGDGNQVVITSGDRKFSLNVVKVGYHHYSVMDGNISHDLRFYHDNNPTAGRQDAWQAFLGGEHVYFSLKDDKMIRREQSSGAFAGGGGTIVAPMPGKVARIKVKVGQTVKAGEGVVVVEAMKMENEFKSAIDGVVKEIKVAEGESVEGGAVLVVIEAA